MATAGANKLPRPPGYPAPGGEINIDSAPGGSGGSAGATRWAESEGRALGGASRSSAPPSWDPPESAGSPVRFLNPAGRAPGSRLAALRDSVLGSRSRLAHGFRPPPRPGAISLGLLLRPGPGPLQGSATPTSVSPGADPSARAPAVRPAPRSQVLPPGVLCPFPQHPGPQRTEPGSLRERTPSAPAPAPLLRSLGAEDPAPVSGTLLLQELRPQPLFPKRGDPGPARPSPARPSPGAPRGRSPCARRPLAARRSLPAPRSAAGSRARGAGPPPQQLSRLRGLRGLGVPRPAREGARL